MEGREKDFIRGTYLAKSTLVENGYAVGQGTDHCEIMRDKNIGGSPIRLELAQQIQNRGLDRYIERRRHLVAKDEFGFSRKGTRHRDPLLFPPDNCPGSRSR